MDLTALLFTTWLRPKTRKLFILTDVHYKYIREELTDDGIPCGLEIVSEVVLTPVGAQDRATDSIPIDGYIFKRSIQDGLLVRIIAPKNLDQLSNQIIKNLK